MYTSIDNHNMIVDFQRQDLMKEIQQLNGITPRRSRQYQQPRSSGKTRLSASGRRNPEKRSLVKTV